MQVEGCRVQGAGCRVQGAGCRVQGSHSDVREEVLLDAELEVDDVGPDLQGMVESLGETNEEGERES